MLRLLHHDERLKLPLTNCLGLDRDQRDFGARRSAKMGFTGCDNGNPYCHGSQRRLKAEAPFKKLTGAGCTATIRNSSEETRLTRMFDPIAVFPRRVGGYFLMFGNMFNTDRLRQLITTGMLRARAIRKRYREFGFTQAEMRGINLLKEWLSPEQLVQYESHGYFDVIGGQSGKRYRIRYGTQMNITQIGSRGNVEAGFCFVPLEPLVAGEVMLTQKIALETDERIALAVAKRFSPTWH